VALRICLLHGGQKESIERALGLLTDKSPERRNLGFAVLIHGTNNDLTRSVSGLEFDSRYGRQWEWDASREGSSKPIMPAPPPHLEADRLRPLLADEDSRFAAKAGYLLALLGEEEGLPKLLAEWRKPHEKREPLDEPWEMLVYRAITVLDNPKHVPVLEEIYQRLKEGRWEIREFYWTIRSMKGEAILKLRKKIRDEVGMETLS
jgi:hypothetical protein